MTLSDRYMVALACVLLGYAMLGKGFAYVGLPPLFVGEVALLSGIVVAFRSGYLITLLAFRPSLLLLALVTWTMLRTVPFIGTYGFDALRDSVIAIYSGFAFIVAAMVVEDPRRIRRLVHYYQRFVGIYIPSVPVLFALAWYFPDYIPRLPRTTVPVIWLGPGEVGTHLAGVVVFAMAGFCRMNLVRWACLLTALVMVSASSRAAILAFIIPVSLAALALGRTRVLAAAVVAALALLATAYTVEKSFTRYEEPRSSTERRASPGQLLENMSSILGHGGDQTESTKEWRERWWGIIMEKTVYGPYFWTGRGYGPNLALEDGFGNPYNERPLRSPHNSHLTMLARGGIPGAALWGAFLAAWFGALLNAMLRARRRGRPEAANLLLFVGCYVLSCAVNAAFDVALEAPMQGIWFWCLIGFGSGTTMVYRYLQDARQWNTQLTGQLIPDLAKGMQAHAR
jgi:hypothetical protein